VTCEQGCGEMGVCHPNREALIAKVKAAVWTDWSLAHHAAWNNSDPEVLARWLKEACERWRAMETVLERGA
jgi:hypothetical protein